MFDIFIPSAVSCYQPGGQPSTQNGRPNQSFASAQQQKRAPAERMGVKEVKDENVERAAMAGG